MLWRCQFNIVVIKVLDLRYIRKGNRLDNIQRELGKLRTKVSKIDLVIMDIKINEHILKYFTVQIVREKYVNINTTQW